MRYIVMLGDLRGAVNLRFYRIGERIAEGMDRYHAPVEHELSRKDLNRLTELVLGFLLGRAESEVAGAPSFYRVVRSELLVYGKRRGDLFERELDDQSSFEHFVGDLLDRIEAENTPVA